MKNTAVVAGVAAAFLVLAPGAALASTTPTPTPTTTKPSDENGPQTRVTRALSISPSSAKPGTHVLVDFRCQTRGPDENVSVNSGALSFAKPGNWGDATVKTVKPGKYLVTLHCGPEFQQLWFVVQPARKQPAKQVTKVPAGAPQTGGTDGPAGDSGTPLAAAGAMGVLALGGSGLVLARRVRRR
jgi:hypothetical protein